MHLVFIACDGPNRRAIEAENSCLCLLKGENEIQRGRKCSGSSLLLAFEWRLCCRQIDGPQWRNEKYTVGFIWQPPSYNAAYMWRPSPPLCCVGCAWTKDLQISLCALLPRRPQGLFLRRNPERERQGLKAHSHRPPYVVCSSLLIDLVCCSRSNVSTPSRLSFIFLSSAAGGLQDQGGGAHPGRGAVWQRLHASWYLHLPSLPHCFTQQFSSGAGSLPSLANWKSDVLVKPQRSPGWHLASSCVTQRLLFSVLFHCMIFFSFCSKEDKKGTLIYFI